MTKIKKGAPSDIVDDYNWHVIGLIVADFKAVEGDVVMLHEYSPINDRLAVADIMADVAFEAEKHYERALAAFHEEGV